MEEEFIFENKFKSGEDFICSVEQPGITIYAFKGEKPDEIVVCARDVLNQDII